MTDGEKPTVYFDNAATSWPKPEETLAAMVDWQRNVGGSPGRSGHALSVSSSRILEETRAAVADLFGFPDVLRTAFAKNVTEALNCAIFSLAKPGSRVVVPKGEHNSVMRPLRHLEQTAGVRLSVVDADADGVWSPGAVLAAVDGDTSLVVAGHASNVTGRILPALELARPLADRGVPLVIDGAQTAGALEIDLSRAANVAFAFTGHKSLLGPTGVGGLLFGEEVNITPLLFGGTGSRSDLDVQPDAYPDSLESGTMNMLGIAGLGGAIAYLNRRGLDAIRKHEKALMERFMESAAREVPGIRFPGGGAAGDRVAVTSFAMDNLNPSQAGLLLDRKHGIMCRIGLHCNPNCHQAIGTFPEGTVRFAFSPFTTAEEVDYAVGALAELARLR